jgi:hypothetical protein
VDPERLCAHSSTRRPAIQCGDLAVCYAAVWQALFAVVEVSADPEHDPERYRWAWRIPIRPLSWLDDLDLAPPVQAAGVFPQSLGRHSYIRLDPERFAAARELVEAAALPGATVAGRRNRPRASADHSDQPSSTLNHL